MITHHTGIVLEENWLKLLSLSFVVGKVGDSVGYYFNFNFNSAHKVLLPFSNLPSI